MTIQELSQELNISAQALRQWCKKNNVRKERTQGKKATYILDCDTVTKAKAYYLSESKESNETKEEKQRKESNESKLFDILQKELDTLREQFAEKDKTIESLLKKLDEQIAIATKFEERLQAEQILHAGTIKALQDKRPEQAQSEAEKEPEPEQAQTSEPAPKRSRSERQQPPSLLEYLKARFRRKQ